MKNIFRKLSIGVFCFIFSILAAVTLVGCGEEEAKQGVNAVLTSLNEKLATAEQTNGKNLTMHDALKDVEINDFSVAEENAKQNNKFVWNAKTDRFVIVNSNGEVVEGNKGGATNLDLWLVSSDIDETFSTYYIGSDVEIAITTSKGFDAGNNTRITTINYTNEGTETAIIRTNSNDTILNINTNGTIKHYGEVGLVNITKVSTSSYRENGIARTATIKRGRFVVEDGAKVVLLQAKGNSTIQNNGEIEAYVGTAQVGGTNQPTVSTSATVNANTVAIIKGNEDQSVLELPATLNNAVVILLKDYTNSQVTLSGETTIYGNMNKLNAKISGDNSNIVLKNVHTTALKLGEDNSYNGTLTLDGGQLDYDAENFSNSEDAAFYARRGNGTYTIKNMTITTGPKKGIKVGTAKSVTVQNCVFDAQTLSAEAPSNGVSSQPEVYNRSLSCIDIQVQNSSIGAQPMQIEIVGNTFANVPQGSLQGGVSDSDSAGAIKIKAECLSTGNSLASVLIEGNTFTNCYRDVVVGVNVRFSNTDSFVGEKDPATLKNAQNNVDNANIYTIQNNNTTHTDSTIANRGVLIVDNRIDSHNLKAYAENVGVIKGGCAVFNTYKTTAFDASATVQEILDSLFAEV